MEVDVEECIGMPADGTDKFIEFGLLMREMSLIIQPTNPLIMYEKFFIDILKRKEISLNDVIKVLVGLILMDKYKELPDEIKANDVVH